MKGYWIGLVCAGCLFGNWHDTSTGLDLNKLPHPALTRVRGEPVRAGEKAEFDGIWAAATQEEATLRGKSKSGKRGPFTSATPASTRCGAAIWMATARSIT